MAPRPPSQGARKTRVSCHADCGARSSHRLGGFRGQAVQGLGVACVLLTRDKGEQGDVWNSLLSP